MHAFLSLSMPPSFIRFFARSLAHGRSPSSNHLCTHARSQSITQKVTHPRTHKRTHAQQPRTLVHAETLQGQFLPAVDGISNTAARLPPHTKRQTPPAGPAASGRRTPPGVTQRDTHGTHSARKKNDMVCISVVTASKKKNRGSDDNGRVHLGSDFEVRSEQPGHAHKHEDKHGYKHGHAHQHEHAHDTNTCTKTYTHTTRTRTQTRTRTSTRTRTRTRKMTMNK